MHRSMVTIAALLLAGCGPADETRSGEPGSAERHPVELANVPETAAAGGLLELSTSTGVGPVVWSSDGGKVLLAEDHRLLLRLPYDAPSTTVTATPTSSAEASEVSVTVELIAPRWRQISSWESDAGPPAREYGSWWPDPGDDDRVWLYGGNGYAAGALSDLHAVDLQSGAWTALAEPSPTRPLLGHGAVPISEDQVLIWGGIAADDQGYYLPFAPGQVLAPQTAQWLGSRQGPDGSQRYQAAVFHDGQQDQIYTVCGSDLTKQGAIADCPVFAGHRDAMALQHVPTRGTAEGREGFAWAWVEAQRRLVAFSGETRANPGWTPSLPDQALVAFDVEEQAWSEIEADGEQPPGRRNPGYFYDIPQQRLFVFGGTADGQTSLPGLWVLHLDEGAEQWHRVEPEGSPPDLRSSAMSLYLPARQAALLGFGNSATETYRDLWMLHLAEE